MTILDQSCTSPVERPPPPSGRRAMSLTVSFEADDNEASPDEDSIQRSDEACASPANAAEEGRPPVAGRARPRLDILVKRSSPTAGGDGPSLAHPSEGAKPAGRRPWLGKPSILTPSSCRTPHYVLSPTTPDPQRSDLIFLTGDVGAVLFDFDGTLTASPGDSAQRCRKTVELVERAPLLAPRLRALREAGLVLGIISKSSKPTIDSALHEAKLAEFFNGPVLGKAVGFEGKAGFIEDLVSGGQLHTLGISSLSRVLLVDDDVRELERARSRGVQTYSAPPSGGLQDDDFDAIFGHLGISSSEVLQAQTPKTPKTPSSTRSRKAPRRWLPRVASAALAATPPAANAADLTPSSRALSA